MSRSKRAAGGDTAPVSRESVKWYRQTGWLLAVSLVCCTIVTVGVRLALGAAFTGLFRAWGVDAATVTRAPTWAQLVYRWHGSAVTLASAIALIGLSMWLRGLWTGSGALPLSRSEEENRRSTTGQCALFALIGLAAAALVLAVSILPDSIRAERAAPRLTWTLPVMLVVAFISTLAEELFTKRVLYDGIASRWGTLWATLVSAAGFFLMAGVALAAGLLYAQTVEIVAGRHARQGRHTSCKLGTAHAHLRCQFVDVQSAQTQVSIVDFGHLGQELDVSGAHLCFSRVFGNRQVLLVCQRFCLFLCSRGMADAPP